VAERLGGAVAMVDIPVEDEHALGTKPVSYTHLETRVTILGHVQRGGTPVAFDRVLATRCV